jgi:hypothetical protein
MELRIYIHPYLLVAQKKYSEQSDHARWKVIEVVDHIIVYGY